jgi:hypothetical protein
MMAWRLSPPFCKGGPGGISMAATRVPASRIPPIPPFAKGGKNTRFGLALLLACGPQLCIAEEYRFDVAEIAKKTFEFSGYAEAKQEALTLRPGSVLGRINFPGGREYLDRSTGTLELAAAWNLPEAVINVRSHSEFVHDPTESSQLNRIQEGGVRWALDREFSLDMGKRVQRWGKGYAWNPVGFVERPKDPNDPQTTREGYLMAGAEWVKSLGGPLATLAFTPLVVPTRGGLNADFGETGHLNPAAKLYLLWNDTDIDFLWQGEGSRPARFGADFSRNLNASLEVHGEWARILDQPRQVADVLGNVTPSTGDADSWLLGLRYLTEKEVTWIAELYRNGTGYSATQLGDFYRFADTALTAGGAPATKAVSLAQAGYGRANPGRDYLYLRVSAKDPFDVLYYTPAVTTIVNLDDHSFSLTPEIVYTGITNLELRGRLVFIHGGQTTDFGEKPYRRRIEVYARWYF